MKDPQHIINASDKERERATTKKWECFPHNWKTIQFCAVKNESRLRLYFIK